MSVGGVALAQVLHFAAAGDKTVPGDRVAGKVAAVAVDGLIAEEIRIENCRAFLVQGQAPTWECKDREPTGDVFIEISKM